MLNTVTKRSFSMGFNALTAIVLIAFLCAAVGPVEATDWLAILFGCIWTMMCAAFAIGFVGLALIGMRTLINEA